MKIDAIELYQLDLPYSGGVYRLSGGREYRSFDATFVRVITDNGLDGWGESTPFGSTYIAAHAADARAGRASSSSSTPTAASRPRPRSGCCGCSPMAWISCWRRRAARGRVRRRHDIVQGDSVGVRLDPSTPIPPLRMFQAERAVIESASPGGNTVRFGSYQLYLQEPS